MPEETRIELLYFDGCPSLGPAGEALRQALAEEGIEAAVDLVAVNTGEEARRLRFPGSPTIRFNGEDAFPAGGAPGPEEWGLRCRVYATPGGLEGSPTTPMLREALRLALPAGKESPTN
ncbi:thioredoxin family protein [Rubrobacter tropicus]|uniref:Thioredoxin family protein n=1 Tax=Rubrobacter tropicus TaxID=2653851 RepID=A0A6G8QBY5_9ACTN|nr:thioredoxin family protein [Rubrobacter tropicus]QIN83996.1 thioredoxin family protein [Rubrobacter tropicus]